MNAGFPAAELQRAYALCKLQAQVDGAFDEKLLQFWFEVAWDRCAVMIGFEPPGVVEERIQIDANGLFRLSHTPSGPVEVFAGYTRVAVLQPPFTGMGPCDPSLCCFCDLKVRYPIGSSSCSISPSFLQAVARVFAYIVENRGDTEMDAQILKRSGAFAFLEATGGICYAA